VASFLKQPEALLRRLKAPERVRRWLADTDSADPGKRALALGKVRMELFREAEAILVQDEFPIVPIYFYVVSGLAKPHLKGFYPTLVWPDGKTAPNVQDLHPLRDMWVDRGAR
jgi:hypothetical protein